MSQTTEETYEVELGPVDTVLMNPRFDIDAL